MTTGGKAEQGFSVAEVLVAISLSAIILGASAMFFQTVTANQKRLATIETVTLGTEIIDNFYDIDASSVNVYSAPNYGRAAFAAELRTHFFEDLEQSVAVYCLGRDGLNTIRPSTIDYSGTPFLDTPSAFLTLLQNEYGTDADVFVDYVGGSTAEDATIYMIGTGSSTTELQVLAVYDVDIVQVLDDDDNLEGNYVSVRRYVGGGLANYYDIYYEAGSGNDFSPMIVHFPKASGASYSSSTAARFMVAAEGSFYLIWWPDPSARFLEAESPPEPGSPTYVSTDPVMDYWKMGGRTSFMFAVPMFPASY